MAAQNGHQEIVQILVGKESNVEIQPGEVHFLFSFFIHFLLFIFIFFRIKKLLFMLPLLMDTKKLFKFSWTKEEQMPILLIMFSFFFDFQKCKNIVKFTLYLFKRMEKPLSMLLLSMDMKKLSKFFWRKVQISML